MDVTVNPSRKLDAEVRETADSKDYAERETQKSVVELLGRLSVLMAGIGEEMRGRYEQALALREFAETMYLAFGEDLKGDIEDIRYDTMEEYGSYMKANLLGDNRLRESVAVLARENPDAQALLQKLETNHTSFGIEDGLGLINHLLGVDLKPEYYRNAAGSGFSIAFDEVSDIMDERKVAMMAAIRDAQRPLQILQEMIQGREEVGR